MKDLRKFPMLTAQLLTLALLYIGAGQAFSQTRMEQFKSLNGPMKRWTMVHPFAAQKALPISKRALALTDSIRLTGVVGTDFNGGDLDAFRHGVWMALLVQRMTTWKAASLGRAYERGNHSDFRKGKLEDGSQQDAVASEMDLINNEVGRALGERLAGASESTLVADVIRSINRCEFVVIVKDEAGNSRDEHFEVIPEEAWRGKWRNARCLWPKGYIRKI